MKIVISITVTIGAIILLGLLFMYSGVYNVAASKGHNPVVRWFFSTIQERSVEAHAPPPDQVQASSDLASGYRAFTAMCVMCHGSPTQARWEPARSMIPIPPKLIEAANEWSLAELTWVVEHGIKMTGMPAFGPSHSREEISQIASFVDTLPNLSVEEYKSLIGFLSNQESDDTNHSHDHGEH